MRLAFFSETLESSSLEDEGSSLGGKDPKRRYHDPSETVVSAWNATSLTL
jgi:hypothetical protein